MPDPIMSTPGPLFCQAEEPEPLEIEPVVITGSKTPSPLKQDLNAPFTAGEAGSMAVTCLSEIDAIAILAIGAAPVAVPVAMLGAFKVGFDYSKCMAEAQSEVLRQRRTDACRLEGGTPLLTSDYQVLCELEVEP
jgi:hypothetical protein